MLKKIQSFFKTKSKDEKSLSNLNKKNIKSIKLLGVFVFSSFSLALLTAILIPMSDTRGASYVFTQSSWTTTPPTTSGECSTAGGTWDASASECYASDPTNQTGWTTYASSIAGIVTGSTLTLNAVAQDFIDGVTPTLISGSSGGGFNNGDPVNVRVRSFGDMVMSSIPFACGIETLIDADGNSYNTVQIGADCWMAENLNVGTAISIGNGVANATDQTDNGIIEKWCYNNTAGNCDTYGGLYAWSEAMNWTTTEGAQGICPAGSHIPTDAEWSALEASLATGACDPNRLFAYDCSPAGTDLKVGGSTALNLALYGYKQDGFYNYNSDFAGLNAYARFWTSSLEPGGNYPLYRGVYSANSGVLRSYFSQDTVGGSYLGNSIRCVVD